MSGRLKATLTQARFGLLSSALTAVRGVLLIPIYVKVIGPDLYGLWLASGGILAWLTMLDLGLVKGLNQRIASAFGEKKPEQAVEFMVNGFLIYLALSVLVAAIGIAFSYFVPRMLDADSDQLTVLVRCFQLAVLALVFRILSGVFRAFCLSALRPTWPLLSMNLSILGGTGITVIALYSGFGLWAIPIGMLFTDVFHFLSVGLYAFSIARKHPMGFSVNARAMKDLWRLTPSLFGSRVGSALIRSIEPTIIALLLTPAIATAFAVMRRAADVIAQALQTGVSSTLSGLAHLVGEGNSGRTKSIADRVLLTYFVFASIGFGLFVIGSESFVSLWIGETAFLGIGISALVACSLFLRGFMELLTTFLTAIGHVAYASWGTLIEAALRLVLMYALVASLGVIGAPVGMVGTCFLASMFFGMRFRRNMSLRSIMARRLPAIWTIVVAIAATILFVVLFPQDESWFLLVAEVTVAGLLILGLDALLPAIRTVFAVVLGKATSNA